MTSCSGSVRSYHDEDENTPLNEKLEIDDLDRALESGNIRKRKLSFSTTICHHIPSLALFPRCSSILGRFILGLLPVFFWSCITSRNENKSERLHTTAYLDGVRGLAAFAVFLCHLSYTTFDIGHSYGAGRPGEEDGNKNLLQLPIIRLLYSGPPMVAIFFVISGYALSYKPLKQMHEKDMEKLILTLTSSVFRRVLRLFLPCLASTFIIVCLTRMGVYKLTEDFANGVRAVHEDHYWTAPTLLIQLGDWTHQMIDSINVFDWSLYAGATRIDPHLWTIPAELRCSMALFITHLLVARMSPKIRLSTMSFLLVWGSYWNRWEMFPFWAGAILAELDLLKPMWQDQTQALSPYSQQRTSCQIVWKSFAYSSIFVIGLYLASYPDVDGHVSPGYVWLTGMIPSCFHEKHRFWGNIGAVMIVGSISNLQPIKRFFMTSIMQYLGKISFPLYICHGFVIHTFTYAALDWIWEATNAWEDWPQFVRGFAAVAACTIVLTVWISDVFLRIVDLRCLRFAKWFESKIFS